MAERKVVSQSSFVDPSKVGQRRPANTGSDYQGTVDADWTCNSCGHGPINGSIKICPTCGNPKDSTEKYVPPTDDRAYLTEKEMSERGIDLDHYSDEECPFCQAKIAPRTEVCPNCGGIIKDVGKTSRICPNCARETNALQCENCGEETDSKTKEVETSNSDSPPPIYPRYLEGNNSPQSPFPFWKILSSATIIAVIVLSLIFIFKPREKTAIVTESSWSCSTPLTEYQYNQHSDWSIPTNGDYVSQSEQVHHFVPVYVRTDNICEDNYEVIGSHSETNYEQVCETHSEYSGSTVTCYDDGSCDTNDHYNNVTTCNNEAITNTVSDYGYVQHCRSEEVYDQVPVFQTKYIYNIWEWVNISPSVTSGSDNVIVCPTIIETDSLKRSGSNEISCKTTFTINNRKSYSYRPNCASEFPKYKNGTQWTLILSGPSIKSIAP